MHKVAGFDGIELEECTVRVFIPLKEKKNKNKANASSAASVNNDDAEEDDDDDASTVVPREFMDFVDNGPSVMVDANGVKWKAKYQLPLKAITIKGTSKKGIWLQISLKAIKQVRELIFNTEQEADQFEQVLRDELAKEESRSQTRMQSALEGTTINDKDRITFLVEVVAARDIPVGDFISSDPYVQVIFNGREIHKTKYIPKT